jgi:hypothetical protein
MPQKAAEILDVLGLGADERELDCAEFAQRMPLSMSSRKVTKGDKAYSSLFPPLREMTPGSGMGERMKEHGTPET